MLGFFDDEPAWARLLVLETPLTQRSRSNAGSGCTTYWLLCSSAEAGRPGCGDRRAAGSPMLLATLGGELVVGGVFSVIRTSISKGTAASWSSWRRR